MYLMQNVPLSGYSTMRLGGNAAYLTNVFSHAEIAEAVKWAHGKNLPVMMIGGGSNIIWRDEGYPGLVLVNKIQHFDIQEVDTNNAYVTFGGGENWDNCVEQTTNKGLSGLELLSLIPGTAGAAPVQNIGAYGQEISNVLVTIKAYDTKTDSMCILRASECDFGYRTSRFKTTDRNRFFITAITVLLTKQANHKNYYHSLQKYFNEHHITEFTPQNVRAAVISVRQSKLPDPATVANTGSFFANPIITKQHMQEILDQHPKLAAWPSPFMWELPDGKVKVAAGALIDCLGLRGYHDPKTGMATWPQQGLVLVNESASSTSDLLQFKSKIVEKVQKTFRITLEQEPELI